MIIIVISKKLAMISKRVEIIKQKTIIYAVIYARVMELVDMLDSKSGDFTVVWVRVPSLVKTGTSNYKGFNPLFF